MDGLVPVRDATVSSLHCIVVRRHDGGFVVQDVSRNGTWLDGRRLIPNVQVPLLAGQVLAVGHGNQLVLKADGNAGRWTATPMHGGGTAVTADETVVTVLVGDIRNYTDLVRSVPANRLEGAVSRIFRELEAAVVRDGGSIKEYQGDAIFAFWEDRSRTDCAEAACRAALDLNRIARELGADPAVWDVKESPLRMDWALATGPVVIRSHGEDTALGLTMIGEAVPLAYRIEKLATDETGPILACEETRKRAGDRFEFRDLGRREAKGFAEPPRVFSLQGER